MPSDTPPAKKPRGNRRYRQRFKPKKYAKRVARENERGYSAVSKAIPKGASRPSRPTLWLQAIRKSDFIGALNSQARENVWKLALIMARSTDMASMTIKPGWDYLIKESGLSRSTVNRVRQRLHDAGLLGTVGKGRTKLWTTQLTSNDRAVYVLCIPSQLRAVEKSEPPTGDYEVIAPRTREHASVPQHQTDTATPRRTFEDSPQGLVSVPVPASRPQPSWPGDATTKSAGTKGGRRETERQAALALQEKFFELRRTTTADIATRCRPFFMAGWTINDIAHALNWTPSGKWEHDGATGIRDIGRWMAYRLQAWMRDGTVLPSPYQRQRAEKVRQKAIRRKALDERAARLQALPQQDETNRRGAALARAVLRGDAKINLDTGEVTWKCRQDTAINTGLSSHCDTPR